MRYFYYCRDKEKDNRYHIRKCPYVEAAFKKDSPKPFYIHGTKDNIKKLGRIPCLKCKPDGLRHVGDFLKKLNPDIPSSSE